MNQMKSRKVTALLLVIVSLVSVFAVCGTSGFDSDAAGDSTYTYTINASTGAISGGYTHIGSSSTGKYVSTNNTNSGSWTFDDDGYGPFNSFYAAFDPAQNNLMICHLDPDNLMKSVDGTIDITGKSYNIMWCLPTVYWKTDSSGNLILTNDSTAGGTAYAHTVYDDSGTAHTYAYVAYGVYEAGSATVNGSTDPILTSFTGADALNNVTRPTFRMYANNQSVNTDGGDSTNGYAMLWNFYQYELYKYCATAVMGGWDSQGIAGNGFVYRSSGNIYKTTGLLDTSGPYAGNRGTSTSNYGDSVKVFLENVWGSVYDFVDGIVFSERAYCIDQKATPDDSYTSGIGMTILSDVLPSSGWGLSPSTTAQIWGMPTANGGSNSSGLYDYVYSSTGQRLLHVGGYSGTTSSNALSYGLSCVYGADSLSYFSTAIGGRLAFVFDADPASTPTVKYDHSNLTTALNDGGAAAAALPKKLAITEGGTYEQLEAQGTNGEWRHIGWEVDGTTYSSTAKIELTESHTAKSLWTKCSVVTLNHDALTDLGGSTSGLQTILVIESTDTEYPDLGEVDGFTHAGWYVDGKFYANGQKVLKDADHTAYSGWKVPTITITFMVEGTENGTLEVPKGSSGVVYTPLNVEGAFVGWYYDSAFSEKYDALKKLTSDTTLYAKGVKPLVFTSVPTAEAVVTAVDAYGLYFFDATDSDGRYAVQWDFGDGNTSTDPIAYNSYAQPGKYTVTLTVTNANGETATSHYDVNYGVESGTDGGTPWGAIALVIVVIFVGAVIVRRFL